MAARTSSLILTCVVAVSAISTRSDPTPITRVVELLRGLKDQTENDMNTEEKLYEKFVCWGKTVISSKSEANSNAKKRIQELQAYIGDIDSGRIEFSSERVDLERDMAAVLASMEEAQALRNKEHEEFLDAEDEMVKAVAALNSAISVLEDATAGHEKGALLQRNKALGQGTAVSTGSSELIEAVNIGEKVLNRGDAIFLRRLLIADVPTVDWKKLNRKATFKLGYKARSFKIQGVLRELNSTISTSLADARAKEKDSESRFTILMQSKNNEKDQTQGALQKMEEEQGARSLSKEEAQAEVDALSQQVDDDTKYIAQTKTSLAEKKRQWTLRHKLQLGEIAAISKAIEILSNDDARDLFKRSLKSQGYSFWQSSRREGSAALSAADSIRRAAGAVKTNDVVRGHALSLFASRVAAVNTSHFVDVIAAIDRMVGDLRKEENTDLEKKEHCEKTRLEDTRTAGLSARSMDERTDEISTLESEIQEISAEIAEKNETKLQTQMRLDEATENREAERKEFVASAKDDADAKATVERAKDVLQAFYSDNGMMFVQRQAPGEAPPDTWESAYTGKTDESTSILAVLSMIIEDIAKDAADAQEEENDSKAEYNSFKDESDRQIDLLNQRMSTLDSAKSDKEKSKESAENERKLKKGELDVVMKKMMDAQPGCDFISINYQTRLENRRIEIDGLVKAKAILTGGDFTLLDPNREIKPGDAFLARRET